MASCPARTSVADAPSAGVLLGHDNFMNVSLGDVVCTSREGDKFWSMRECHIRGVNIKYFRIPEDVADTAKEDEAAHGASKRGGRGGQRGAPRGADRGGRGAPRGAPRGGRGGPNERGRGGSERGARGVRGAAPRGGGSAGS